MVQGVKESLLEIYCCMVVHMCVCLYVIYTSAYVCVHVPVCTFWGQRKMLAVFYHTLFLETQSLTEPGARSEGS